MINPDDQLGALLRSHNYSNTASRRTVFEKIQKHGPLTVADLVNHCGTIDRASVYRAVQLFETLGIARRLYSGWKYKVELSDLFGHHHHHATCNSCGHIIPLDEDAAFEAEIRRLAQKYQFAVDTHQVELSGICAVCQAK